MKHRKHRSTHHWILALLTAGLLALSVPEPASAQRGRTDEGRRVERKSDTRASKGRSTAKVQRGSNSRGTAVTGSAKRGGNARSGGSVSRSDSRSGGNVRQSGDRGSGMRSGGIIIGERNRSDRRDRDGDYRRDWDRGDRNRRGGGAIFVPPGLAKKHVKYHNRRAHRSRVDVRVTWPWVVRYEAHWHPRVRTRHVIHVHVGSGSSRRLARMEFETVYRQRVRHANRDYAVIDIDVEEVMIYRDGRYMGRIDRIPGHLSRATATVWRNGDLEYDRDIFVVGNSFTGFELISEEYGRDGHTRVRAGDIDLRSGRVRSVSRPRLYDPYAPDRFYVQSLLPEDVAW